MKRMRAPPYTPPGSPLTPRKQQTSVTPEISCFSITGLLFGALLCVLRIVIWLCSIVYTYLFASCPWVKSCDGKQLYEGISVQRGIRYGPLADECMDLVMPCLEPEAPLGWVGRLVATWRNKEVTCDITRSDGHAALFIHGGGWAIPGSQVQFQQLTPWARSGVTVFSLNYPLTTPFSNQFPTAIVSTLKALAWLKQRGFTSVSIVGESAGGQIGSLVAAYLHNPLLLTRLGRKVTDPISRWDYPTIRSTVLWYAILDQESWVAEGSSVVCTRGLQYCLDMHRPSPAFGEQRLTLCDLAEDLLRYPPTLFIAGRRDPLGLLASSQMAHSMLGALCETRLQIYDGTHGFCAYPPILQWLFGAPWKTTQKPASEDTVRWIQGDYVGVQDCSDLGI